MQDDVQVLRGTKLDPRLFHRKSRGRAADQHELIGVAGEVSRKTSSPLATETAPSVHRVRVNTLVGVALQAERQGKWIDGFAVRDECGVLVQSSHSQAPSNGSGRV